MLSYYPPMSGENDDFGIDPLAKLDPQSSQVYAISGRQRRPTYAGEDERPSAAVMLCDVDKRGNLYNCRPYAGPSAMHGDDLPSPNTMICDVDRHGNLVNCRPYYGATNVSPHGWDHGPYGQEVRSPTSSRTRTEVRSPTSTEVRSPTSTSTEVRSPTSTSTDAYTSDNFTATVTGGAGAGATTSVNIYVTPSGREMPVRKDVDSFGYAGPGRAAASRQHVFTPPLTTRQHSPRGHGYAGMGLAPRPWNWNPYYTGPEYMLEETDFDYDPNTYDDPDFGIDPLLAGVGLGVLGGYGFGLKGAALGGLAGYYGAKRLR